ncbi:MAG: hypothetical protein V4494_02435 [Chlamydiota bacterium]
MKQAKLIRDSHSKAWKSRLCAKVFQNALFRSWWTLLLCILSFSFYTHAMQKKEGEYQLLQRHLDDLEVEKRVALEKREDLLLQISSQSDPAWIQLMLMKGLGLVPEGQQKVYFKED